MVPDITTQDKRSCSCEHRTTLFWCGAGKNVPVLHFRPDVCLYKNSDCSCSKMVTSGTGLTYKFVKTECRLLRQLLEGHGFREIHQNSNDFNIMWCGCHVKPYTLRGLTELQKVNHFPRSYEITRKDRLYKNYMRMRQSMGAKHYNFLPVTFVLPSEINEFYSTFQRERGYWIAKPVASSRGRGISIISHPNQINLDEQIVVCKYISNPLLVDGFKFDLRIYVMVTSFDPLRIYIFNEGLARFSTVRYDGSPLNLGNIYMHLTNYSINKKSSGYVKCSDPDIEDYGNKWSMSALLRYLKNEGFDTASMMMKVEDLIIKTLLSAEIPIANACRMFLPHRENCFELFGFDVIFDEDLKPWLLEVNLSPSLACESPLDLKIKSNLLSQMLTLAGVVALDPYSKRDYGGGRKKSSANGYSTSVDGTNAAPLSNEDLRLVRQTKEEFVRKGAFFRVFPSEDSWDTYSQFLENKTHYNFMLHSQLFPNKSKEKGRPSSAVVTMNKFREMNQSNNMNLSVVPGSVQEKYSRYEKSLQPLGTVEDYPPEALLDAITPDFSIVDDTLTDSTRDDASSVDSASAATTKKTISVKETAKPQSKSSVKGTPIKKSVTEKPLQAPAKVDKNAPSPEEKIAKPEISFDPQIIINKATSLTKVQARLVFSNYLSKLQDDLNEDIGTPPNPKQYEEQMETVLRFLSRASTNLHLQVFRVVVPSRRLPLADQRRILAKELGDFIHIYNKETVQLSQRVRMRQVLLQTKDNALENQGVSDVNLSEFLLQSEEIDVEKVLVAYSSTHPSSALFLGEVKHEDISSLISTKPRPIQPVSETAGYTTKRADKSKENTKKEETSESTVNKSKSEDSKVTLRDGAIARDVAMTSSRDKCLSRDTSCLSKSSSKLSMGTVSSSGYGSFVSSGSGKNCVRPSTATGAGRGKVNDNNNNMKSRVSKSPATNPRKSDGLKRWSSSANESMHSPYAARKSGSRDSLARDCASRTSLSRDCSSSRDNISRSSSVSRDKSRTRPTTVGPKQRINTSISDISLVKPPRSKSRDQSRDQVARKTAAPLKNPKSKEFVQSVWTEEFCKLMDLRMYLH